MQGWFDDSGKEGWPRPRASAVYLLAGFVAPVRVWAKLADAWDAELKQTPKLKYLHTGEAYTFSGEFGPRSKWRKAWGARNKTERDKRLLKFAKIVEDHLAPIWTASGAPDRLGVTWMVSHREYADFKRMVQADPRATRNDLKTLKNPYYLSFQYVLGA